MERSIAHDQPATTRHAHVAVSRSSGVITRVGVATLVGATLFGIGWRWRDLRPIWRMLIYNVTDIRIPIVLPAMIGEVFWDFLADRRAISLQAWRSDGAASDSAATRGRRD